MTRKDICIQKICCFPLDFGVTGKSSLKLMQESMFEDFYNHTSIQDIKDYLFRNKNLIENWKIWSENKRTWGYYLSINPDKYFVGLIDKDGNEFFSESFITEEDACANFILIEASVILDINNDKFEALNLRKQFK